MDIKRYQKHTCPLQSDELIKGYQWRKFYLVYIFNGSIKFEKQFFKFWIFFLKNNIFSPNIQLMEPLIT